MSLLLAAAIAASASTLPVCNWNHPGVDPYMGNVVTAVDRYDDIPEPVRAALKSRMAVRQYDDIAVIRRDSVAGKHDYGPEIRDMHFGQGRVCLTVTRSGWTAATEERGLVYCESGHCIIVPTVCRNVSRITRLPDRAAAGAVGNPPGAGPADGTAAVLLAAAVPEALPATTDNGELEFEAPGAGPSFAQQADPARPGQAVSAMPLSDAAATGFPPLHGSADAPGDGPTGGSLAANAPGGNLPRPDPGISGFGRPGGSGLTIDPNVDPNSLGPVPPVLAVPEPGAWALWLLGLATLASMARRRRGLRSSRPPTPLPGSLPSAWCAPPRGTVRCRHWAPRRKRWPFPAA